VGTGGRSRGRGEITGRPGPGPIRRLTAGRPLLCDARPNG
jgi:hypothetical protein